MFITTKDDFRLERNELGEYVATITLGQERGYDIPIAVQLTSKNHVVLGKLLNIILPFPKDFP